MNPTRETSGRAPYQFSTSSSSSNPLSLRVSAASQAIKMEMDEPRPPISQSEPPSEIIVGIERVEDKIWNSLPEESPIRSIKNAQSPLLNEWKQRRETIRSTLRFLNGMRGELEYPIEQEIPSGLSYDVNEIAHFPIPELSTRLEMVEMKSILRSYWAIFKNANVQDTQIYAELLRLERDSRLLSREDFCRALFLIRQRTFPIAWNHMDHELFNVDPMHGWKMRELLFLADSKNIQIPLNSMEEYVASAIWEGSSLPAAEQLLIHEESQPIHFQALTYQAIVGATEAAKGQSQPGILKNLFEFLEKRYKKFGAIDIEAGLRTALNFYEQKPNKSHEELTLRMLFNYAINNRLTISQQSLENCFKMAAQRKMAASVKDCYASSVALGVPISGMAVGQALMLASLENDPATQDQIRQLIQTYKIEVPIKNMTGVDPLWGDDANHA